jgi:hypothetical protein
MPEIGTSSSMSGDGKRSVGHRPQATAPVLDSTIATTRCLQRPRRFRGKADTNGLLGVRGLALLWQIDLQLFTDSFSAVWAPLSWRSKDEIDDGVAYRRQAWLRRRSVDSFFSAPLEQGDGVAGRRRRSWSSARDDEGPARIAPQSDQARAPLSTADAPVRKSIVP